MARAGVQPLVNHWNEPMVLLHDAATTHAEQHKSPDGKSPELRSKPTPAFSILPPEKLMPFVIPFKGGPGALCGGAATSAALTRCVVYCLLPAVEVVLLVQVLLDSTFRCANRSDSLDVGLPSGMDGMGSTTMFPLPPEYAAAVQQKQESVSKLRGAVKSVCAVNGGGFVSHTPCRPTCPRRRSVRCRASSSRTFASG